jgi:chemotaxis protein MotB
VANRKKRRDTDDGEPRGAPEYMLTYGDMVTLLLCFFVLLLSMSTMTEEKVRMVLSAFKSAVGIFEQGPALTKETLMTMGVGVERLVEGQPAVTTGREAEHGRRRERIGDKVRMVLRAEQRAGAVKIRHDERGVVVHLTDKAMFDQGSADLKPSSRAILDKVAMLLRAVPNAVRIEGHTDNTPIQTARFPSNWELSVARATQVLRYLEKECKIDPTRLSCSGYGEWRPLRPNTTPENRALNRRVDIVILREDLADREEPSQVD